MMERSAKWIWGNADPQKEEYYLFRQDFELTGTDAVLCIAAETDYIARVNGKIVGYCAFAGWRDEKYYDKLDLSDACRAGLNRLEITVRYEGVNSSTHIDDGAGLIFTVAAQGTAVAVSGSETLCTEDPAYISHAPRHVTGQLGLTSCMRTAPAPGDADFRPAVLTGRTCRLLPRPVRRLTEEAFCPGKRLADSQREIYDLGRETAGVLCVSFRAAAPCTVKVVWGEHIADGCVRYRIGGRDFSFDFSLAEGVNGFEQRFVRVAGRYLEVIVPEGVEVQTVRIGLVPVLYPLTEKETALTGDYRRIYDTCVRTLRLCMHTHYEDCPWREQALYVLDSRNQMLCGYEAFEETEFQRANLVFMSKGKRADGMLELTYPAVNTPAIPFFSAMYPVAVEEYVKHTGDTSVIPEVIETVFSIMKMLTDNVGNAGLVRNPPPPYWNFYEWSPGSDGHGELHNSALRAEKCDLILNCAYVLAARAAAFLCRTAGIACPDYPTQTILNAVRDTFFEPETGNFRSSTVSPVRTRLCNAFALLVGLGDARTLDALMNDTSLVPETLSMAGFVYDAILAADPGRTDYVLADISRKYLYMLSCGATSFWETIEGEQAFAKAGSLCHGWSAIPIVYLRRLVERK